MVGGVKSLNAKSLEIIYIELVWSRVSSSQLLTYDLLPADIPIAEEVAKRMAKQLPPQMQQRDPLADYV